MRLTGATRRCPRISPSLVIPMTSHPERPVRAPRAPAAKPPRLIRKPLAAAVVSALALWSVPVHAALVNVAYELKSDGTAGWDPTDDNGMDTGPNNGRVRTNDEVTYQVSISHDGTTQGASITLTLPSMANGKPMAQWPTIAPADCAPGSTISSDRQTLTCRIPDQSGSPGTSSGLFRATILGSTPNNTQMPAPTLKVGSVNTATIAPATLPRTLTITAAPFYDVVVDTTWPGSPKAAAFQEGGGPDGKDGFYHRMLVGLLARNPNGNGKKGVEQLDPTKPVVIDLDVSGYPQSVRLDNWRTPQNTPNQWDRPTGTLATGNGCGSPWGGGSNPGNLAGGELNMHQKVLDTGVNSTDPSTVARGGVCVATRTASGLPDNQTIQITVTGTDTTLQHTPTLRRAKGSVPPDEFWVFNKAVILWTDVNDYPGAVTVTHTLRLKNFSAQSITGQTATNGRTSNDAYSYPLINQIDGEASKIWFPDSTVAMPWGTLPDPAYTGDKIVDYMAPGQHVGSRVTFNNRGSVSILNFTMCDVLDRSAFDLGAHFSGRSVIEKGDRVNPQYGVHSGSPYFSTIDTGRGPRAESGSEHGSSAYSQASCADPAITWYDTPEAARAAGEISYVRLVIPKLQGGASAHLYTQGLQLRNTWASTVAVQWPKAEIRQQGQTIAENTVLRNRAWVSSDNMPQSQMDVLNTKIRDHLQVQFARTITRIQDRIVSPADASTAPLPAGTELTYELQPRFATPLPPQPATVTVTDLLPSGVEYIAGSARKGEQAAEPSVEKLASGQTRLTWTYENAMPHAGADNEDGAKMAPITFKARMALQLRNGDTLQNQVSITGGTADAEPDCTLNTTTGVLDACSKKDTSEVRVQTPPSMYLDKQASTKTFEPGDTFHYTVTFYALGQDLQKDDVPDIIDILPFVGDGTADASREFKGRHPESKYAKGAFRLVSVERPEIDPGMQVYYTRRNPAEIHNDPRDTSNAIPGGSTKWCRRAEFGQSNTGCPDSLADVTAIRTNPALNQLASGQPYGFKINLALDSFIATPEDILSNRAAARSDNPNGSLLLVLSRDGLSSQVVPISADKLASVAGRVFIDMDGTANSAAGYNKPLGQQCIKLTGTNERGETITISTQTDDDGNYSFTAGSANRFFVNGDCSGTALPNFNGIRAGTYTLSRITPASTGNTASQPKTGSEGGDASATEQLIGNISLKGGKAATSYNFTETPPAPQLTLVNVVNNTHGGSRTSHDVTMTATQADADGNAVPATQKSGKNDETAVTAAGATAGTWTLASNTLSGYKVNGWTCEVTNAAGEKRNVTVNTATLALPLLNGDKASCTVTYADKPATLTLINTVTNSNGRSNTAADFDLSATGPLSGQNGGNGGSGNNGGSGGNGGNAGNGGNTGHGGNGGSGNGGSTQTAALSGKTGTPTVTSVQVLPGSYRLHATNLLDSDGKPIYVPGAWSCTVGTDDAAQGAAGGSASGATSNASGTVSGTTGSSAAGRTSVRDVTIITEDSGNAQKGDADVTLANGDNVVCTINHSDAPVSLSLKLDIINQYGGTATTDDNTVSASGQGKEIHSPKKSESSDPVPVAPGVYRLTGLSLPGYQTGSWACDGGTLQDTYVVDGQTQNGPFLVTGNRANIGCRFTLKDIPASIRVEKSVAGEPALVAGTANEYTVQHIVTVTHQSGVDATYDLTDTPAFDPDVQVVSTQVTLDDGSTTSSGSAAGSGTGSTTGSGGQQVLDITPTTLASGTVQWPLASRRVLKMQNTTTGQTGRHVYRMTSRIRVPFGSSTGNNSCTTGTTTGGNGLYNAVSLTHYDGALQPINSTPLTSQACVNTPEPIESTTLVIEKTSNTRSVEVGDLLTYRLRIRNTGNTPAIKPVVVDLLPRGFRFEPGSVRVQNATATNVEMASSRELRITLDRVDMSGSSGAASGSRAGTRDGSTSGNSSAATGKDVQITYRLRAGVGSQEGDGINRAHIQCVAPRSPSGLADCSNESRWKVQVTGGIFSEEACLAGQIFVDCNGNSIKDREELGIPGVRLYLENGTWLVSDEQGKYSHCGLRPRTHVLKVDSRTLPRRSRLVTSSPQNVGDANSLFIDARKGMLHRADFIEGSCSATVIEQVKARQAQGPATSVQTEGPLPPAGSGATEKHHNTGTPLQQTQPALTFDSKGRLTSRPRQQGTDSARQPLSRTRY